MMEEIGLLPSANSPQPCRTFIGADGVERPIPVCRPGRRIDRRNLPKPQDLNCYLPTEEEIAAACLSIQETWDEGERLRRMGGNRPVAAECAESTMNEYGAAGAHRRLFGAGHD